MVRPTINSEKHLRQLPINQELAGTIRNIQVIKAVASPSTSSEIRVGAVVKAVYVEIWLLSGSSQPGSVTVSLEKLPGTSPEMSFVDSATLNDYGNKKNILYVTQGLTPDSNGNPVPFMRQWYKIPKGKQRFGLEDSLQLNLSANLETLDSCGVLIFKEYF